MLKSAVIGCGAVSKNHGKALKNSEYTHLEYCVDIDIEKAKAFPITMEVFHLLIIESFLIRILIVFMSLHHITPILKL